MRKKIAFLIGIFFFTIACGSTAPSSKPISYTPEPTYTPSPLSVIDIENQQDQLTDIQWEEYKESLTGTRVQWKGRIREVEEDHDILLDAGNNWLTSICLKDLPYDFVINLNKDQVITFEGTISSISDFLGLYIYLVDVIIPIQEQISNINPIETSMSTPSPTATENPYLLKPGTYIVGVDIRPGIYVGYADENSWNSCYWERLSYLSGEFDSILANDNSVGRFYMEVIETDYAITTDCPITHIDGFPIPTQFPTELEPGMYLVGRDIQPGLYKGQAGEELEDACYWERLSSLTGSYSSIIAEDYGIGSYYVDVASTDYAIRTDCALIYVGK